MYDSIPAAV